MELYEGSKIENQTTHLNYTVFTLKEKNQDPMNDPMDFQDFFSGSGNPLYLIFSRMLIILENLKCRIHVRDNPSYNGSIVFGWLRPSPLFGLLHPSEDFFSYNYP
jgi:hypothetical protein